MLLDEGNRYKEITESLQMVKGVLKDLCCFRALWVSDVVLYLV